MGGLKSPGRNIVLKWIASLLCIVLLAACSQGGSYYVGTWQNVKNAKERIAITHDSGHTFLMKTLDPGTQAADTSRVRTAILKDGVLTVDVGGMGKIKIVYDKSHDELLMHVSDEGFLLALAMGGQQDVYKRVKQ